MGKTHLQILNLELSYNVELISRFDLIEILILHFIFFNHIISHERDYFNNIFIQAMDSNGYSDPYARFLMDGALLCKSDTKKKNLNPEWNQFFAVKIPGRSKKLVLEGESFF